MRAALRRGVVTPLVLGLLAATACSEGPAEEALTAAEEALESHRESLERFAPRELRRLSHALGAARAAQAEGRHTQALRMAQELPAWIRRATEVAERRRLSELTSAWDDLSRELPPLIARLGARVAGLSVAAPAGGAVDARPGTPRAELQGIESAWEEANTAFEEGDVARALATARSARDRARALIGGLPSPSPPVTPPGRAQAKRREMAQ